MKVTKSIIGLSIAAVGAFSVSMGVLAFQNNSNLPLLKTKAAQIEVDFSELTITRRIYFFIDGYWSEWSGQSYVLHYTLDGKTWSWSGDAFTFYGDYYNGLYAIDITAKGIGSSFTAQVKAGGGDQSQKFSTSVTVPSLADRTHDVIHVESGNTGDNRTASISAAGADEIVKIASFLNMMSTCNASYAFGYNAYPQFKANFLDPENSAAAIAASGNTQTVSDEDEEHVHYTVNQKIAELAKQYGKNGWYTE